MTRFAALADTLAEIPASAHAGPKPASARPAAPNAAAMERAEAAVLGLVVHTLGNAVTSFGTVLRLGPDVPLAPSHSPITARDLALTHLGDLMAATEFACLHGVFDRAGIEAARDRKLAQFCDPANADRYGRPLAPQPIALGTAPEPLPCHIEGWSLQGDRLALQLRDAEALYGFEIGETLARHLLDSIAVAFPQLMPAAPARTTLTTSRRDGSVATFVFDRQGEALEVDFDWETAREVRTAIDARFPDTGR